MKPKIDKNQKNYILDNLMIKQTMSEIKGHNGTNKLRTHIWFVSGEGLEPKPIFFLDSILSLSSLTYYNGDSMLR